MPRAVWPPEAEEEEPLDTLEDWMPEDGDAIIPIANDILEGWDAEEEWEHAWARTKVQLEHAVNDAINRHFVRILLLRLLGQLREEG